jgi:hypothetical protein
MRIPRQVIGYYYAEIFFFVNIMDGKQFEKVGKGDGLFLPSDGHHLAFRLVK